MVFPLAIGRPATVAAAQQAVREQRQILVVLQHDPEKSEIGPDDLHRIGTVANIVRYVTAPDGTHHVICQGVQRFRVTEFVEGHPFLLARGLHLAEPTGSGPEIEARFLVLQQPGARGAWTCCRRCRPSCARPWKRRSRPARWPTSPRPISIPSRRRSRRSWRRSSSCRGSTRSRRCSPSASRCCGSRTRSASRPRPRSTPASARCCCASRWRRSSASWATTAPTSRRSPTSRRRSATPACRPRSRPPRARSCAGCSARPMRRPSTA